ncbi:MAG: enoyl-CoA hydratase/isomerase family protein [Chloroflexi bacterium]|nr:enoyl-CoA hydratase/isomerase family protein [Chloroflexota bacterium]
MVEKANYTTIQYEKSKDDPHIVHIRLNRPDKNNAISIGPGKMTAELQDAVCRVNEDEKVKVVIYSGNGRNFCAGFDLSEVYRVYHGAPGVRPLQSKRLQVDFDHVGGLPRALLFCNKVTIAQVHGWCIEAGMYLVETSDIAIASKDAKISHRGQRLAFGGQPFMPFELFQGHTKKITEILLTGRTISAEEAEEIGIITKAVEPEELEEEVLNLARAIALLPIDAIVMGKMRRRISYELMGAINMTVHPVFHTLSTNLVYADDEKEHVFIRDRERIGEKEAFHKLHEAFEEALDKTKYFKSFGR